MRPPGLSVVTAMFLAIGLLAIPARSQKDNGVCDGNTAEITACLVEHYRGADADLNAVYQKAIKSATEYGPTDLANLKDAQRKWVAYLDAACETEFSLYQGGTAGGPAKIACLWRITDQRTHDLKEAYHLPDNSSVGVMQSVRLFLLSFDSDVKDQFIAALADLNGDGTPEAIVYLTSKDWCGSGGCTLLILVRDGESWRILTKVTITRPPIRVLKNKTNGWRDIGVWVQGGGVQPGYEAELQFDGKTYPTNPSVPPAKHSVANREGETVIPSKPLQRQ